MVRKKVATKPNLFQQVRKNTASRQDQAPKKSDTKASYRIRGLYELASIRAVLETLTTLASTIEGSVKTNMVDKFIELGMAERYQPANFEGMEKDARASCQLQKRASSRSLRDEEIEILKEHEISTTTTVKQEEVFVFNPKYLKDQKLLRLVSRKLHEVEGLPEDFIELKPEVVHTVTTPGSINEVFSTVRGESAIQKLVQIVATPVIRTRLSEGDVGKAFQLVADMLDE